MRRKQAEGRTGALRALEREAQALTLRRAGADYRAIARTLGYAGPGGAYKAVTRGLARTLRDAGSEELRGLELDRLDSMQLALWPMAIRGDVRAIDGVLHLMERRARLLGLDAPARSAATVDVTVQQVEKPEPAPTDADLDRWLAGVLERNQSPQPEAPTSNGHNGEGSAT